LAGGGRAARTGTPGPRCAGLADPPAAGTEDNPAELARIAAAALDIATDAHHARDYEAAIRAAFLAIDAIAAIARTRPDDQDRPAVPEPPRPHPATRT
jgi:hypothetical protein